MPGTNVLWSHVLGDAVCMQRAKHSEDPMMYEVRGLDGAIFGVGPTELDAWINALRKRGKLTDLRCFLKLVQAMKEEGTTLTVLKIS